MNKFTPYLAVITNFKRTNQSIVTLVALSSHRRIELNPNSDIQATIKSHYTANNGNCSIFGQITKYHHIQKEGQCTVYDLDGVAAGTRKFVVGSAESVFIV